MESNNITIYSNNGDIYYIDIIYFYQKLFNSKHKKVKVVKPINHIIIQKELLDKNYIIEHNKNILDIDFLYKKILKEQDNFNNINNDKHLYYKLKELKNLNEHLNRLITAFKYIDKNNIIDNMDLYDNFTAIIEINQLNRNIII